MLVAMSIEVYYTGKFLFSCFFLGIFFFTILITFLMQSATSQMIGATAARPSTSQIRTMSARSASFHSVMRALIAEAEAGFPFRNYLKK